MKLDDTRSIERAFKDNKARFVREWMELLRFPSVSADRAHDQDCLDCAKWLAAHFDSMGFKSRLIPTPSKPLVFAERDGYPDKPTVLFYGHYDVQPADPLDEWNNPPFDPVLKGGRIYARGAQDNKGQLFASAKAMETLIRSNALKCRVKIIIEGEEENGSRGMSVKLKILKRLLKADVLMVIDTDTVSKGVPTIVMGLRGIISLTAVLRGPHHDLHSGLHGGIAPNPAHGMARLLATLHNPDGSVAVNGFYDGINKPTRKVRTLANKLPFSAKTYRSMTGVPPVAGESHLTPAERVGFRPTIEINGIHSGYGGEGSKTIIPAKATAKISARLVEGQDPCSCLRLIVKHLKAHAPNGLRLDISEQASGGPAVRLDPDSALAAKAKKVLDQLTERETVFAWDGASIPIVAALSGAAGAEPLLVGFGHQEDVAHGPNESFSIEQFRLDYLYTAMMLKELGRSQRSGVRSQKSNAYH